MPLCKKDLMVVYGLSITGIAVVALFSHWLVAVVIAPVLLLPLVLMPVECRYEGGRLYVRFPLRMASFDASVEARGEGPRGVVCHTGWRLWSIYASCSKNGDEVLVVKTCGCKEWVRLRGRSVIYACC